jgi:hypothetical protein
MKKKASAKTARGSRKSLDDLSPRNASDVKGGAKLQSDTSATYSKAMDSLTQNSKS